MLLLVSAHKNGLAYADFYAINNMRRIDKDALSAGLSAVCVNHECCNVDIVVSQYSSFMVA